MKIEDFGPFTLSKSNHSDPSEGMCVMEMVSFLAGEEWSDMPLCSSPAVSRFCQVLNDLMGQGFRDKLQSYVPRLIGTASPEHDSARSEYLAWAAIRVFAPIALRNANLSEWAERLEGLTGSLDEARLVCVKAENAATVAVDAATYIDAAYYAMRAVHAVRAAAARGSPTDFAYAAAYAVRVPNDDAADTAFRVLDGLLEIGPSGDALLPKQAAQIEHLKQAMANAY